MRQIVLDTETTGLEHKSGHRIIEIGAVEVENRKLTGRHYHQYINPERDIDAGAQEVHGITRESLLDKPVFADIAGDFLEFVTGAELVIHNAPFDIGFLDNELKLCGRNLKLGSVCSVVDSLLLARSRHPGQKNNLDALCKRYLVDNSQRDLHGALLDAEILADLYLVMTGGQTDLGLGGSQNNSNTMNKVIEHRPVLQRARGAVLQPSAEELSAHSARLSSILEKNGQCIWLARDA
ncbi:MAG: DNA polymerase III subunit epsilon [Pseudomonadales bacterium]